MLNTDDFKSDIYDYFCKSINTSKKGVFLITDKQSIFYYQGDGESYSHDEIRIEIEKMIHPNKNLYELDTINYNIIFGVSLGHELIVDIPNGRLSYSQFLFFIDILKKMDKFNKSGLSNQKIELLILKRGGTIYKSENPNVDEVVIKLNKLIIHDIRLEDEKIIGTTLDDNTIIGCMKYQIDLENCTCLEDLMVSLSRCNNYYNDSYYKFFCLELLNDYLTIINFYYEISKKDYNDISITDITYNNLEDKLREVLNALNNIKKV